MTSIERTAYPRFGRLVTARELLALSPTPDETAWARGSARSDAHLLALVVSLKCFERLGYFPGWDEVPEAVVDHLRRCLDLREETTPEAGERTAVSQRDQVRERLGVVFDPERARAVAAEAIRSTAQVKNNPPDLINVALELLVKASLELPAFSTLNRMTARIRTEVNTTIFEGVVARMAPVDVAAVNALLDVIGPLRKSLFDGLKQSAGRAS